MSAPRPPDSGAPPPAPGPTLPGAGDIAATRPRRGQPRRPAGTTTPTPAPGTPHRPGSGPPPLSEDDFLQRVRDLAHLRGWKTYHTRDSRGSEQGWPDLVLAHRQRARVLFVELKTDTGTVTATQRQWLDDLSAAGLTVLVWRPADWARIEQVLAGAPAAPSGPPAPPRQDPRTRGRASGQITETP